MRSAMDQIARTPKQIGEIIRRTRRQKGWSQSELGEKAGLRQEAISKVENGSKATRIENICDILTALGLELVIQPRSRGSVKDIEDLF